MPHSTPLIGTIVAALVAAFAMGALAHRLRLPPIAGYLLAGVIVGPFTPGYVAHGALAAELAEIGVILLMFGVGLHFSLQDLLSVRRIAVPGAIAQIIVATLMGMGLAWVVGWTPATGLVFGLALSVASTVVLLRALEGRGLVQTERGRIAIGWLIVEDLVMVLALVLLPVAAQLLSGDAAPGGRGIADLLGLTIAKMIGFVALMLVIGKRVIPWALHWVAHSGSRELFRLAVLTIALGVAFGAARLFGVSFALGAFFAGMLLGETQLGKRATEETLPLRDAFAVLFFVSVGMLFNPAVVLEQPGALVATVAIIVVGKSLAAFAIVRLFGHPTRTALTIAASLAQIGEFSFILAGLGVQLDMVPDGVRDLVLAGAILSILINPFLFRLMAGRRDAAAEMPDTAAEAAALAEGLAGHVILVGHGRVGGRIARGLFAARQPFVVIEEQPDVARSARDDGFAVLRASATRPEALRQAGVERAARLLIAIPEGFEAGVIAERARAINPALTIISRAHSDEQVAHMLRHGADEVVMGEQQVAAEMLSLAIPKPKPAAEPVPAPAPRPARGDAARQEPPRWFKAAIWTGMAAAAGLMAGIMAQ
ncbi:YbaL family putative K(+) efflux transporter [Sphingomonas quercus]|uniref:Kef family K(+) transporter n=1 Tax=Sphingomonas quercus TaxID=2842451 RepID=A0ABS6BJM0_9SPHN|nr:YbaL family putative K(+) efflux transporter [Sphingomonas quercus]MBU3077395.1 Kef family K(+) transporter [Sphingomonas quercus]